MQDVRPLGQCFRMSCTCHTGVTRVMYIWNCPPPILDQRLSHFSTCFHKYSPDIPRHCSRCRYVLLWSMLCCNFFCMVECGGDWSTVLQINLSFMTSCDALRFLTPVAASSLPKHQIVWDLRFDVDVLSPVFMFQLMVCPNYATKT